MAKKFTDLKVIGDDSDEADGDEDFVFDSKRKKFVLQKNATLYLVDARKKMFVPSDDQEDIPFVQSLQCVRSVIRNKIFSNEKCLCGVVLLGTDKTDNNDELQHISVLQPLQMLSADHILRLDGTLKAVKSSDYEKQYGFNDFKLGDAFWLTARTFSAQTIKINKEIILFTNDDNPLLNHPNDHSRVISSANDMAQNGVSFDLIHLGNTFDVNKFYKEIIQLAKNDLNFIIPDPVMKMKVMLQRVTKINFRHVALAKLPFFISDDFRCSVSIHHLIRKVKPPSKIKLSKATNERVVTKMQMFEPDTGDIVDPENLVKIQNVGMTEVTFSQNELKDITDFGERGLKLLGFKPASILKLEYFVKPCAFIYPDETECKGSSIFFVALLKRCIAKQVVAICSYYPRPTSTIRFVALVAQDEILAADNSQESPPGFVVFFLPFAEEIRDLDEKCTGKLRANPEQVDLARKLVKKLKFKYTPEFFPNPKIGSHWAAVEALALDLEEPEIVTDECGPDYPRMASRTKDVIEEFIQQVYPEGYSVNAPVKRPKLEKAVDREKREKPAIDVDQIEEIVRVGKAQSLTNDMLKTYLQSVGLGKGLSKTKKAEMIERVCIHLNVPLP